MPDNRTGEARAEYWREQIEAWRASGKSQHAYCRSGDLNYSRFVYWRRKFEEQASREARKPDPGFVPVTRSSPVPTDGLSLILPSGVQLRGINADNLGVVRQLLGRLA